MNTDNFDQFKEIYKDIQPPEYLAKHGWEDLASRLPAQEQPKKPIYRYGFLFAAILLCLTAGIIGTSQSAQPGSLLYPVKSASEQLTQTINKSRKNEPDKAPQVVQPTPKKVRPTATPVPTATATPTPTKKPVSPTVTQPEIKATQVQHNGQQGNSQNNNGNGNKPEVAGAKTDKPNENKEKKEIPNQNHNQNQNQNQNQNNQDHGNSKKN